MIRTRVAPLVLALVAFLCTVPAPAHGAWPHPTTANLPVCTATATQRWAALASDGAGGILVAWMDGRGADWNIYIQRVSADGTPLWTADGVPVCTAAGSQTYPVLAGDGAGGAIVAWEDQRPDYGGAYAQRISADGAPLWVTDGVRLCAAANGQSEITIVPTLPAYAGAANGAILLWKENRTGVDDDLYAQEISPDGILQWSVSGLPICLSSGSPSAARMIPDGEGGAVAAWYDTRSGGDVYVQRIHPSGMTWWGDNGYPLCTATGYQTAPSLAPDGTGGAIVSWSDYRTGDWNIYAQRIGGGGVTAWATDGVPLCSATAEQWLTATASDGVGGAFVFWRDQRNGLADVYGQRVSPAGVSLWSTNGVPVCTVSGEQTDELAVPDGTGGALVAWLDSRSGTTNVYLQRLSAGGAAQWATDGVPVGTASGGQSDLQLLTDGLGGGFAAWADRRAGDWDIYAQRVDRWGCLGAEPVIASVRDIPNDEGGRVKLSWDASPLDTDVLFESIGTYRVYRSVPAAEAVTALEGGEAILENEGDAPLVGGRLLLTTTDAAQTHYWEYLGSVSGDHMSGYSYVAPTTGDSLAGSNPLTAFLVQARGVDGARWWNSAPDSGYSVDNLPPAAPTGFTGVYGDGRSALVWAGSPAADFREFRLYRGHGAGFVPGPADLVATLTGTDYMDEPGAPYFYKLCVVDTHGNVGPFATLLPEGTADVPGGPLPRAIFLAPPVPNPAPTAVTLRFGLPRTARIELALHDQQGRRVRTLFDGECAAGEHSLAWDVRDGSGRKVSAGLYFVRLEVEGRSLVTRLAVIR